eukprot:Skav218614  [mRNA]  locus=scaffold3208:119326:119801:- [translate_table: standard]
MPETWKRPRNTIHSNDFGIFKEINDVIQREPIDFLDPELRGNLAAIGIKKGQAFSPDERMKAILTEGASCLKEQLLATPQREHCASRHVTLRADCMVKTVPRVQI